MFFYWRYKKELNDQPVILYHPDHNFVVLWSAKAGSTTACSWFFSQIGLLDEARDYHFFIHEYLNKVYIGSLQYKKNLGSICKRNRVIIKFVRNPFSRVVSSFFHVQYRSAFQPTEQYSTVPTTFREFVDYLSSIDLQTCDMHFALQTHPLERIGVLDHHHLVKMEQFSEDVKAVEVKLGMPSAHLDNAMKTCRERHFSSYSSNEYFAADIRLKPRQNNKKEGVPPFWCFYDDELERQVAHLYQEDFQRYGYSPALQDAIPLAHL